MPLILAISLVAAPALSACGESASGHKQTTAELKRKSLQRRRNQVTWIAALNGSLAQQAAKLAIDRRTATRGHWHLIFNATNVNLTNPRQAPTAAGVLVAGNRIKFAADPKCPNQGKATTGLYTYRVSGKTLTVKEVGHTDSCALRVRVLTSASWTKGSGADVAAGTASSAG